MPNLAELAELSESATGAAISPQRRPAIGDDATLRVVADSAPVMLWMAGPDRWFDWFNRAWLEFGGRDLDHEAGNGWLQGVHPEDVERCIGILDASFEARSPFNADFRMRRHDGSYRWVLVNGAPRFGDDGSFQGYTGSCIDIHERRELEERLAERTRALRLAERRKDEFLALLTHQLRSPLSPIANVAGMMRQLEPRMPELADMRGIIERQLDQLRGLLTDIVDVTRIRQAKISLDSKRVDARAVVRRAAESHAAAVESAGRTLNLTLPDEAVMLTADESRLTQAINHVIANSIRYTPAGGSISIDLRREGNLARIRIKDTGPGISADFLPHVFEPFEQEDANHVSKHTGLGVGLTIAQRLARLHGGDLSASSDGLGLGAEFIFTLPIAEHAAGAHSGATQTPGTTLAQ